MRKKRFKEKFRILNVCSGIKTDIRKVVSLMKITCKKTKLVPKGIQRGDMLETHGSNKNLKKYLNYSKFKNINYGIRQIFSDKYKNLIKKLLPISWVKNLYISKLNFLNKFMTFNLFLFKILIFCFN